MKKLFSQTVNNPSDVMGPARGPKSNRFWCWYRLPSHCPEVMTQAGSGAREHRRPGPLGGAPCVFLGFHFKNEIHSEEGGA